MGKSEIEKLSDNDKNYIKLIHQNRSISWDERMSMLINKFQISERTVRRWIKKLGFSDHKDIENEQVRNAKLRKYTKKYVLVTWAQNATPVHKPFWDNLLAYSKYLNSDIGVIQGKYNAVSVKDCWWDENLLEYLDCSRQSIHPYVEILSDIKVKPTAHNPLNGLEGISGSKTSIVGHPRIHLESVPVLKGHPNKFLLSTGSCTIKNYTDSLSGATGEFHHVYGAVIIELKDDETFYIRQITADDDGSFIDLNNKVEKSKVSKIKNCAAYIYGDIHASQVYEPIVKETNKLFSKITPRRVVLHDLFNGESINHHEEKDPIAKFHKMESNRHLLKKEIEGVYNFIDSNNLIKYKPIVVRSNHDVFIEKWIREFDWKKDLANSKEYMEYTLASLEGKAEKGVLAYLLERKYGDDITCLGLDNSFKINGWELGQHGHLGSNGSRGSIQQFRKLNTKTITGHIHHPCRKEGSASVGITCHKDLGYNHGPSNWAYSGIILHENEKIQHIIFSEDNKFTTLLDG